MKRWLPSLLSILFLAVLGGCAHESAGSLAGGGYLEGECEFAGDCYGGPEYDYGCIFYQPMTMPARMEIVQARQIRVPRSVEPRGGPSGPSAPDAPSSVSVPAMPAPVAREPVVLVSPSSGGRTPHGP
jgi:hypothetical protein